MHAVAPSTSMYVPAAQLMQLSLPVSLAYMPRLQSRGCESGGPPAHQLPAGQSTHASSDASKNVPAAHDVAICMTLPASQV